MGIEVEQTNRPIRAAVYKDIGPSGVTLSETRAYCKKGRFNVKYFYKANRRMEGREGTAHISGRISKQINRE